MIKSWLLRGLALLVLVWMVYDLIFSDHGYLVYRAEVVELKHAEAELEALKSQRERLAKDILRLRNNPKALEDLVHRELGYLHPDEYMIIIPNKEKTNIKEMQGNQK